MTKLYAHFFGVDFLRVPRVDLITTFPKPAFAKAGDLEGDFHDTAWIEGVEALEGIEEMPHGSGVFFLEEFRIRWAAAFTDFLLDGGEELLCPLEYGIAAGISRTGIAQQGFESFGSRIEVALIFQQEGFSKSWLGEVRIGFNRCFKMLILPRKTVRGSLKKETRNGKNAKQVCAALRPRI